MSHQRSSTCWLRLVGQRRLDEGRGSVGRSPDIRRATAIAMTVTPRGNTTTRHSMPMRSKLSEGRFGRSQQQLEPNNPRRPQVVGLPALHKPAQVVSACSGSEHHRNGSGGRCTTRIENTPARPPKLVRAQPARKLRRLASPAQPATGSLSFTHQAVETAGAIEAVDMMKKDRCLTASAASRPSSERSTSGGEYSRVSSAAVGPPAGSGHSELGIAGRIRGACGGHFLAQ